jgi:hypothetical protein
MLLSRISKLPDELIDIIQSYIPISTLLLLNKSNYELYHKHVKQFIPHNLYETYIRSMVRKDCDYVFHEILVENVDKWLKIKKYHYQNTIFLNYLYFLKGYCIENQSMNCKHVIDEYLKLSGLDKNQHKKNISRSIRWKS